MFADWVALKMSYLDIRQGSTIFLRITGLKLTSLCLVGLDLRYSYTKNKVVVSTKYGVNMLSPYS